MSENIFAEIYNKILGLFGQNVQKDESKNTAVNRLRLVLMQDRTNLTPEIMHRMRSELIEVLSKYVELDKEALELNFEQEGEQMALMLSIPVVRAKDEEEIEEAIRKDEEAKKKDSETSDEADEEDEISDSDETLEETSKKSNSEEELAEEENTTTSELEQEQEQEQEEEQKEEQKEEKEEIVPEEQPPSKPKTKDTEEKKEKE